MDDEETGVSPLFEAFTFTRKTDDHNPMETR
jgi:hypothetical protein